MTKGIAKRLTVSIVGLLAVAILSAPPVHADEHDHGGPVPSALVKLVREITEPYKSVGAAEGSEIAALSASRSASTTTAEVCALVTKGGAGQ